MKRLIPLKKIVLSITVFLFSSAVFGENKNTYILTLPTADTIGKDVILLDVGHRYLDVNRHTTNVNISAGLGITDSTDIYIEYAFKNMDILLDGKMSLLRQSEESKSPISISVNAGAGYKNSKEINNVFSLSYVSKEQQWAPTYLESSDQFSYFAQMIFQRTFFNNRFFISAVPTFADNTNFYSIPDVKDYSIGGGLSAGFFVTDRVSLCAEGILDFYGFAFKYGTYGAGIKYAGYRHTFTLWLSNNPGYSPVEYVAGSTFLTPRFSFAFTREFDL